MKRFKDKKTTIMFFLLILIQINQVILHNFLNILNSQYTLTEAQCKSVRTNSLGNCFPITNYSLVEAAEKLHLNLQVHLELTLS